MLTSGGSPTYVLGADHPVFAQGRPSGEDTVSALVAALEKASGMRVVALCPTDAAAKKRAIELSRELTSRNGVVVCRGTPVEPGNRLISHGDGLQARRAFEQDRPAAFVVEVVQASAGACVPPPKYFKRVRASCTETGVNLVLDETLSGFGRAGNMFAFEREKIQPDLVVVSLRVSPKDDGGVVLAHPDLGIEPDLSNTELPTGVGATLSALEVIENEDLISNAKAMGKLMQKLVHEILETRRTWAMDTRGRGLLRALTLWDDPKIVIDAAEKRGLRLSTTGTHALLFAPPLTTTETELRKAFAVLDDVLTTC